MTPPLSTYLREWSLPRGWLGVSDTDRNILLMMRDHLDLSSQYHLHTQVCVGNCHTCPPTSIPNQETLARYMWSRQIDAVLVPIDNTIPRPVLICEIKPAAGYVAFGQVIAMRHLWNKTYPQIKPTLCQVITDACDPELADLYHAAGVNVWCLPKAIYEPTGHAT